MRVSLSFLARFFLRAHASPYWDDRPPLIKQRESEVERWYFTFFCPVYHAGFPPSLVISFITALYQLTRAAAVAAATNASTITNAGFGRRRLIESCSSTTM